MHPVHMPHPIAQREPVSGQHGRTDRWPGSGQTPYFPEGGVAAPPDMIVSPRTQSPGNGQPNELAGLPAIVEWQPLYSSYEQGVGVPPFKAWPRQFHSETYNFDTLKIMPFPDQVGPIPEELVNRPVKAGWSAPRYGEQYQPYIDSGQGVANIRDPATVAYAIGWGYIG